MVAKSNPSLALTNLSESPTNRINANLAFVLKEKLSTDYRLDLKAFQASGNLYCSTIRLA